jgi:large subunit ribosomal protein L22
MNNMLTTVKLRYLRIAPRKVRLVADLIRNKSVEEAQTILNFTTKKAAGPLMKLLKSAVASAKNNFQLEESNLRVSKIIVDEGPKFKRWMPRARGQAYEIQKKTSHITLVLDEIVKKPKKLKKIKEAKKPERVGKPKPALQAPLSGEAPLSGKAEKVPEIPKAEKAKPELEREKPKPKFERGIRRIFQRRGF